MESISERLARFNHELSYEDIPCEVVEKIKLLLLDTIGICISSSQLPFGKRILALASEWGGSPQSTLIGDGRKVSARNAAFANGVLAHGQDFDDSHTETIVHPSCSLVPAVLAVAERDGLSGKEVVTALAGAAESVIRLATPGLLNGRGFQASTLLGTFGAALIAAKASRFDLATTVQALGLSGSTASSGLMECVPAGASAKQIQPGWGGSCGLTAASLAAAGFTGPATVFEGKLGVYGAFLHGATLDLETIFTDIGQRWELLNIRPKLYPCAHNLHTSIECAKALRAKGIALETIDSILCSSSQYNVGMVCEPWERKICVESGYDARFSLPFAVAVALATGKAGSAEFSDQMAADPVIGALMRKMTYQVDPEFVMKNMSGRLTIMMKGGAVHTHEIIEVRGNRINPITTDELREKFYLNAGAKTDSRIARLADVILDIDGLENVSTLLQQCQALLAAQAA